MRRTCIVLLTGLVSLAAIAGGAEPLPKSDATLKPSDAAPQPAEPSRWKITGTVTEAMSSGHYTYVEVDTGEERIWAAGPRVQVNLGDTVFLPDGARIVDFFSSYLDRKFDLIYLVPSIKVEPAEDGGHASPAG